MNQENQSTTPTNQKINNRISHSMMYLLYRHILLGNEIQETVEYVRITKAKEIKLSKEQIKICFTCLEKKDEYQKIISAHLINWKYDRLPTIDKSILLIGAHYILNNIDHNIRTINFCVEMAKLYGDEKSYAYINAILDKLSKKEV